MLNIGGSISINLNNEQHDLRWTYIWWTVNGLDCSGGRSLVNSGTENTAGVGFPPAEDYLNKLGDIQCGALPGLRLEGESVLVPDQ